jgi:serine/threonine protein kinase
MLERSDLIISERYRLLERLHRGRMSEVFLAFDERMQQHVAIKLVPSDDSDCTKRLQSEVRILRKLAHQHILPLLDSGVAGFYHYLVMPYMQRGTLRERLVQGKMTQEEAGVILNQLAGALQYAHKRSIVHRDIKPSNVLLDNTDAGHVYLADFGLAKMLGERSDITQTGCLIGTPEYMAPELAYMSQSVSSDIYALGILLYQMLTGRLPFTGTTPLAIYWKHIQEQPAPPSTLNPQISRAVEQVIMCALDKDPQRRFPGAQAMALAYANALSTGDRSSTLSAIDIPALPPVQVTLRKVETGLQTVFPDALWGNRSGKGIQKGILGLAALVLLTLPLSLGFVLARDGSQSNSPLSISAAFANKVLPSTQATPPARTRPSTNSNGAGSTLLSDDTLHPALPQHVHTSRPKHLPSSGNGHHGPKHALSSGSGYHGPKYVPSSGNRYHGYKHGYAHKHEQKDTVKGRGH